MFRRVDVEFGDEDAEPRDGESSSEVPARGQFCDRHLWRLVDEQAERLRMKTGAIREKNARIRELEAALDDELLGVQEAHQQERDLEDRLLTRSAQVGELRGSLDRARGRVAELERSFAECLASIDSKDAIIETQRRRTRELEERLTSRGSEVARLRRALFDRTVPMPGRGEIDSSSVNAAVDRVRSEDELAAALTRVRVLQAERDGLVALGARYRVDAAELFGLLRDARERLGRPSSGGGLHKDRKWAKAGSGRAWKVYGGLTAVADRLGQLADGATPDVGVSPADVAEARARVDEAVRALGEVSVEGVPAATARTVGEVLTVLGLAQELLTPDTDDGVRASLDQLDGSSASAVSLLTGVPVGRISEYGGMSDADAGEDVTS